MRKRSLKLLLPAVLLSLVLILALAAPAIASGPQSWNLDSHEDADILTPSCLCQMEKKDGPGDNGQSGFIILTANGGSQIWIADQAAAGDLVFHGVPTIWELELVSADKWDKANILVNCVAEIGEWDGMSFNKFNSTVQEITYYPYRDRIILTFISQDSNEVIHKGCYLAIRVTNNEAIEHIIITGEGTDSSCFTSHGGDPGYPEPEPPKVPASSWPLTGLLIGCFPVIFTVFILKARTRHPVQQ